MAEIPSQGDASLATIDFASFVASLATSALMHLGESGSDDAQGGHRDVALARQLIEVLGMLQEKTRGNLTVEEQSLMEHVLYDLRLKWLNLSAQK